MSKVDDLVKQIKHGISERGSLEEPEWEELIKLARLGALVEAMPDEMDLSHYINNSGGPWQVNHFIEKEPGDYTELTSWGETPLEALTRALKVK